MASPDSVTIFDLTGQFTLNKTLSTDIDAILTLQGVSWLMRTGIAYAVITLDVKQYKDGAGVTHIDIQQSVLSGTISGTTENRTLDWAEREHEDHIFGKVKGQSRFAALEDLDDEYLRGGWSEETQRDGVVQSEVVSLDRGWSARQVWGFEIIDGKRYYTRHVIVAKGDVREEARLVYDYYPPHPEDLDEV